ncbi:hypothetical protein LSAT2_023108 [Lamellibrachia satsuma]|nr:hypothetical protein LSAT2_023108 [Lamellibrachia satsuma]
MSSPAKDALQLAKQLDVTLMSCIKASKTTLKSIQFDPASNSHIKTQMQRRWISKSGKVDNHQIHPEAASVTSTCPPSKGSLDPRRKSYARCTMQKIGRSWKLWKKKWQDIKEKLILRTPRQCMMEVHAIAQCLS